MKHVARSNTSNSSHLLLKQSRPWEQHRVLPLDVLFMIPYLLSLSHLCDACISPFHPATSYVFILVTCRYFFVWRMCFIFDSHLSTIFHCFLVSISTVTWFRKLMTYCSLVRPRMFDVIFSFFVGRFFLLLFHCVSYASKEWLIMNTKVWT